MIEVIYKEAFKSFSGCVGVGVKGSISYRPFETIDENGKKITKKEASILATIELALLKERGNE